MNTDFLEFPDNAIELDNMKTLYGFSYNELIAMGFSARTINLVIQKYAIQKVSSDKELRLEKNNDEDYVWATLYSPTTSYRIEIMNIGLMTQLNSAYIHHYSNLTPMDYTTRIEDILK